MERVVLKDVWGIVAEQGGAQLVRVGAGYPANLDIGRCGFGVVRGVPQDRLLGTGLTIFVIHLLQGNLAATARTCPTAASHQVSADAHGTRCSYGLEKA